MTEPRRRLEATVSGRVQGVGFRMFVLDQAADLGVSGWVANESGGRVHVVAEGPGDQLLRLLGALREGPGGARVDTVTEAWGSPSDEFDGFRVRSGWHGGD